ncbi:hypothetical protein H9P43_002603 [Blastocladiella emersonii ATCC 22665]|nr:hypothetical protein H9P43_002603 [Blastocladiella emersonii ATCC 22665]
MSGGQHAVNKAHRYKVSLTRSLRRKVKARREESSPVAPIPAVVFSNITPSKKRLRRNTNRGLQRAIAKLRESGVIGGAGKAVSGGDVEMKDAEHEVIVSKEQRKAKKAAAKSAAAAASGDSMEVDGAENRRARRMKR